MIGQPRGTAATAPSDGSAAVDPLDRVEGIRYLTRVMRGGLEAFMDGWDPAWPVLRSLPYNVKLGADNPDNLYMYGTVSGAYEYRLYGKRNTVTYFSIGCYCGSRPGQGSSKPSHLDSSRLVTKPDGSFEVFLTPTPRGDNWLPLPPDASRIVVRQTFLDRTAEAPADVAIERLPLAGAVRVAGEQQAGGAGLAEGKAAAGSAGATGAASVPLVDAEGRESKPALTAGQVVAGLAGASVFIAGSIHQFQAWSRQFASRPNTLFTLDHDAYMSAWADPAIHFFHGYWRLGPGQALLIQVTPPDCPYWNFQLDNWWMESLDYVAHPATTTNKATAARMPDGSVCLVVAHADPTRPPAKASAAATGALQPSPNGKAAAAGTAEGSAAPVSLVGLLTEPLLKGVTWIDTAHHSHGTMGWRWVLATSHPVPRCRVLALGAPLAEAIREGVAAAP
ncbi:hypothetical protein HYH03_008185 [Edaphochlamys debaryana]|uniref:DUF1214 domain-containing protein n=1 Tax=Edaphochlamys debaryana TaxID=47281 RepID=A0A835Y3Y0_9CHLO|nr:hypothetical protein HYH03_008185 [Edaphochlamys debaryana]|eukprot:KAG2493671.1 hypothetical protein HYH03_008185 [Edaphochlamys debaryana]